MKAGFWVGNDIVDLAEPGAAGKERDARFVERVFTPAERGRIMAAPSPTVALWMTWAAKETAFKIARKARTRMAFAHRAFEVEPDAHGTSGKVRADGLEVSVRWEVSGGYAHCRGVLVEDDGTGRRRATFVSEVAGERPALDGALSPAEEASVHSPASARARLLARHLLRHWGVRDAEIVRHAQPGGWGPPVVMRHGVQLEGFDVSLSHDGRFIAAAVGGPCGSS